MFFLHDERTDMKTRPFKNHATLFESIVTIRRKYAMHINLCNIIYTIFSNVANVLCLSVLKETKIIEKPCIGI